MISFMQVHGRVLARMGSDIFRIPASVRLAQSPRALRFLVSRYAIMHSYKLRDLYFALGESISMLLQNCHPDAAAC